jgi:hypothetical protein
VKAKQAARKKRKAAPEAVIVADCEVCRELPAHLHADLANDEALPDIVERLEIVSHTVELDSGIPGGHESGQLLRCPRCGVHYWYRHYYEGGARLGPPGYDSDDYLTRLSSEQEARLRAELGLKPGRKKSS